MFNFVKQENETLNELYYNLESKLKDTQRGKNQLLYSMNNEVKQRFESILDLIDKGQSEKSSKEISSLYKFMFDLVNKLQDFQDNEMNIDSNNNSNINFFLDEDVKKSSYITQNYEKFKQQEKEKKTSSHHAHYNSTNINEKGGGGDSFIGTKSNIIQNLMNKTPLKNQQQSQSLSNSKPGSRFNSTHQSFNQGKNNSNSFNPNPLTSHLKSNNQGNEKYMNKFISSNK